MNIGGLLITGMTKSYFSILFLSHYVKALIFYLNISRNKLTISKRPSGELVNCDPYCVRHICLCGNDHLQCDTSVLAKKTTAQYKIRNFLFIKIWHRGQHSYTRHWFHTFVHPATSIRHLTLMFNISFYDMYTNICKKVLKLNRYPKTLSKNTSACDALDA